MTSNIEILRKEFSRIERIDPKGPLYRGLVTLLDKASDETLIEIKNAQIPLVSALALNRCIQRKLV